MPLSWLPYNHEKLRKSGRIRNNMYLTKALYHASPVQKNLFVEVRIIATVILVKLKIVVKESFEFFKFFIKILPYGFCSIRFSSLNFVNGVVVNEFRNYRWFLVFEESDFFFHILKSSFLDICFYIDRHAKIRCITASIRCTEPLDSISNSLMGCFQFIKYFIVVFIHSATIMF